MVRLRNASPANHSGKSALRRCYSLSWEYSFQLNSSELLKLFAIFSLCDWVETKKNINAFKPALSEFLIWIFCLFVCSTLFSRKKNKKNVPNMIKWHRFSLNGQFLALLGKMDMDKIKMNKLSQNPKKREILVKAFKADSFNVSKY